MPNAATSLTSDLTLAHLSVTRAGASRVFHRHGLDFCCHGQISLRDACEAEQLDAEKLMEEILGEERADDSFERWDEQSSREP